MPLSEHEQRILDEIERRLAEDDPKLVEQVGRTDLYTHLARRIRLAAIAFVLGVALLLLFVVTPWFAAAGFVTDDRVGDVDLPLPRPARSRSDPGDADRRRVVHGLIGRLASRFRPSPPPTRLSSPVRRALAAGLRALAP